MSRCRGYRAHFIELDLEAALGNLPGSLAPGQSATNDKYRFKSHGIKFSINSGRMKTYPCNSRASIESSLWKHSERT